MPDIPEREPSLPCLPSSFSPLERKTKRKKQRKDKRKIYPYYHHPSYPIPSVRLPSGNGFARSPKRETGYTRACARKEILCRKIHKWRLLQIITRFLGIIHLTRDSAKRATGFIHSLIRMFDLFLNVRERMPYKPE